MKITAGENVEGKYITMFLCWVLGTGCVLPWCSLLAIADYYIHLFPDYHPTRVLSIVYLSIALGTVAVLAYNEAKLNTRRRILVGYFICFSGSMLILLLDLATSGNGGIGIYIGLCVVNGAFGAADALVRGGMLGDLSMMCPDFILSFLAGLAASGLLICLLRFATRAAFERSKDGLRKGAMVFFAVSIFIEFLCLLLYAYIFPKLAIVKYYRSKAATEGSKTVTADLAAGGVQSQPRDGVEEDPNHFELLTKKQLLIQNIDYAANKPNMFLLYALTLSIFPGFLSEDTGKHSLGSWYVLVLIAMFNALDLVGRYIPLIEFLKLKSRKGLMVACISRLLLIPAFYFTAKYGDQGGMIVLTSFLGLSSGYLTVCVSTVAPKGYKGPEQNALGNLLVLCLLGGVFAGAILDWLWLIGKGW